MTDEQWRQLDWEDEMYRAFEKEWKPPRFDPFIELDPPISMIKTVISKLKQQSYEYQKLISRQRSESWPTEVAEAGAQKIISRIKSYQYRLTSRERTGSWNIVEQPGSIGEDQIRRAKEVPIESLYNGTLRRGVGRCPFHIERTGSFHIKNNRWHCFGACGVGGDSIDFVIKLNGLSFIEAVKYLTHA